MSKIKSGTVFIVALSIIIIWLLIDKDHQNKEIKRLRKEIDENEDLTNELKIRLSDLINNNKEIDPKIANELCQIAALLEIKQDTSAVLKLAKIIENLLKELYKGDADLKLIAAKNNRKKIAFADYLELAKNRAVISNEDYHLLSVMVIIRNEEAHQLDIQKEKSSVLAAIISGMGIIIVLCRILKKTTINPL